MNMSTVSVLLKNRSYGLVLSLFALLLFAQSTTAATLDATVNRSTVAVGESFTLTLVADGVSGKPDLQSLEENFDLLSTSTRREVQIINGEMSDLQSWDIQLMPRRLGDLVIPSLRLEQVSSQPLTIKVVEQQALQAQGQERDVFIEVDIDNESPFVQSQVIYSVRFFSAVRISEAELSEPATDKFTIKRLGEDTNYVQERAGRRYRVVERRFAMFPRESGEVEIPPASLKLVVPDPDDPSGGFFGRVKRINVGSPAITLQVRAKPPVETSAQVANRWWLPAKSMSIEAVWEGTPTEFRVGEPVTRVLRLEAAGVTAEQLPELTVPQIEQLRIYSDKPEVLEQASTDALIATRIDKWAVIPQRSGEMTLPAVNISWFDTVSETYRVATVAATTLNVLAAEPTADQQNQSSQSASGAVSNSQVTTDNSTLIDSNGVQSEADITVGSTAGLQPGYWKTLALAALGAWLLTLVVGLGLWWRWRQTPNGTKPIRSNMNNSADGGAVSSKRALHRLRALIAKRATTSDIGQAVLDWAEARWPDDQPRSLQAVANRYKPSSTKLREQLQRLDRDKYGSAVASAQEYQANTSSLSELADLLLEEPLAMSAELNDAGSCGKAGIPHNKRHRRSFLPRWMGGSSLEHSESVNRHRLPDL